MKNKKPILFSAMIIVLLSIMMVGGCKKKEEEKNPLTSFIGNYTLSPYHAHYTLAGAPPPTDVCDSSYSMVVALDAVASDAGKLQLTLDASKVHCQYIVSWCFAASKNSSGNLDGSNFEADCNNSADEVIVTSSLLSVIGTSISGSVYYTQPIYHGASTRVSYYFNFTGTKN